MDTAKFQELLLDLKAGPAPDDADDDFGLPDGFPNPEEMIEDGADRPMGKAKPSGRTAAWAGIRTRYNSTEKSSYRSQFSDQKCRRTGPAD